MMIKSIDARFLLVLFIVLNAHAASGMHDPQMDAGFAGQALNFSIRSVEELDEPMFFFRKLDSEWSSLPLSSIAIDAGYVHHATIPPLSRESVYEYYVRDDGGKRFPEGDGTKKFSISRKDDLLYDAALGFIDDDQMESAYCQPSQDRFSCMMAHMQSSEALRFAYAFYLTHDESFLVPVANLTFSEYYTMIPYDDHYCDHTRLDFNCSDASGMFGYSILGSESQGLVISDFCEVYALTANESILRHAALYANGSTDACNVWNADFRCGNYNDAADADGQGSMINGYWSLFDATGDPAYETIALGLTDEGLNFIPSPMLGSGFAKAFESTGDPAYLAKMKDIAYSLASYCDGRVCTPREKIYLSEMFSDAYLQTGDLAYLQSSLALILKNDSTGCNFNALALNCTNSEDQGRLNAALFRLSMISPGNGSFLRPFFEKKALPQQNLSIGLSFFGSVNDPVLFLKGPAEIDYAVYPFEYGDGLLVLNGGSFMQEGRYDVYLNSSSGARFPLNGSMHFIVASINHNLLNYTEEFRDTDPDDFCGMERSVYQCRREHGQGFMTGSLLSQHQISNTTDYRDYALLFSTGRIDPNEDWRHSTCEFEDDDYQCSLFEDIPSDEKRASGSTRQAAMILSSLQMYQITKNDTYRLRAVRYLESANEDCDIWSGFYDCRDSDDLDSYTSLNNQGLMMLAYWRAYGLLGDDGYRMKAQDLTEAASGFPVHSEPIALGLYEGYGVTGNHTYLGLARSLTMDMVDDCIDNACSPEKYAYNLLMLWESLNHLQAEDIPSISQKAWALSLTSHPGSNFCNPDQSNFNCESAYEQGLMSLAFSKGISNYYVAGNDSFEISISSSASVVEYLNIFNITCSVKNNGTLAAEDVSLYLADKASLTLESVTVEDANDNGYEMVGSVGNGNILLNKTLVNETINVTWVVNATYGGLISPRCVIAPDFSATTAIMIDNIHDVISIAPNQSIFLDTDHEETFSFEVHNDADFSLHDLNISLQMLKNNTPLDSSIGKIKSIACENDLAETSNISIFMSKLVRDQTLRFNATFNISSSDDYTFLVHANTTYGGYQALIVPLHAYHADVYEVSIASQPIANLMEAFDANVTIRNNRTFDLMGVVAGVLIDDLKTYDSPACSGCVIVNESHVSFDLLANSTKSVIFSLFSNTTGESSFFIEGIAADPAIGFAASPKNISIFSTTFNMTSWGFPPIMNKGIDNEVGFVLNITNTVSLPLHNISITLELEPGSAVNISSLQLNSTSSNSSSFNVSGAFHDGIDIMPSLQAVDGIYHNISVDGSGSFNATFTGLELPGTCNTTALSAQISGVNNGSANFSLYRSGELLCSFATLSGSNHSCSLPSSMDLASGSMTIDVNMTSIGSFNTSIDAVSLQRDAVCIEPHEGLIVSVHETMLYNLSPAETRTIYWNASVRPTKAEEIILQARSIEGAFGEHKITFDVPADAPASTGGASGSKGSSGGPAGIPMGIVPKPEIIESVTYDYSRYELFSEIRPYPILYNMTRFVDDFDAYSNTSIYNATTEMAGCVSVSRNHLGLDMIELAISINCSSKVSWFAFFDMLPAGISDGILFGNSSLNVTLDGNALVDAHPSYVFVNITEQAPFDISIFYEKNGIGNKIPIFDRPIWFSDLNITYESHIPIENASENQSQSEEDYLEVTKKQYPGLFTLNSKEIFEKVKNFYDDHKGSMLKIIMLIGSVSLLVYLYRINIHGKAGSFLQKLNFSKPAAGYAIAAFENIVDYMQYAVAVISLKKHSLMEKGTAWRKHGKEEQDEDHLDYELYFMLKKTIINFQHGQLDSNRLIKIKEKIMSKGIIKDPLVGYMLSIIDDILLLDTYKKMLEETDGNLQESAMQPDEIALEIGRISDVIYEKIAFFAKSSTDKRLHSHDDGLDRYIHARITENLKDLEASRKSAAPGTHPATKHIDFHFHLKHLSSTIEAKDFEKAKKLLEHVDELKHEIDGKLDHYEDSFRHFYHNYLVPLHGDLSKRVENNGK